MMTPANNSDRIRFPCWILCAFVVSIFTPFLYFWHRSVPFGLALLFLLSTWKQFFSALRNPLLLLPLLYLTIGLAYRLIGFSSASWGNYGKFVIIFIAYWAAFLLWNGATSKERKFVFIVSFATNCFNIMDQFRLNWTIPNINGVFLASGVYGQINFGQTQFIFSIVVFAAFLIADLINNRPHNPVWKLALYIFVVAVSSVYFIAYGQAATDTLCFIAVTLLFLVCGNKTPDSRQLPVRLIGIALLLLAVVSFSSSILAWLLEGLSSVAGPKILDRLQTMQHVSTGATTAEDWTILSRLQLLSMDIESWASSLLSFFFGHGFHFDNTLGVLDRAELTGAGNHSGFIDTLPRYGLFGFVALMIMTVNLWKYFLRGCKAECVLKINVFLCMLAIYNIFNRLLAVNVIFSIMFFIPFLKTPNESQMRDSYGANKQAISRRSQNIENS